MSGDVEVVEVEVLDVVAGLGSIPSSIESSTKVLLEISFIDPGSNSDKQ